MSDGIGTHVALIIEQDVRTVADFLPRLLKNTQELYFKKQFGVETLQRNFDSACESLRCACFILNANYAKPNEWGGAGCRPALGQQIDKCKQKVLLLEAGLKDHNKETIIDEKALVVAHINIDAAVARLTIAFNTIPPDTVAGYPTIAAIKRAFDIFVIENRHVHDHDHNDHRCRTPMSYYAGVSKVNKTFCDAINAINGI